MADYVNPPILYALWLDTLKSLDGNLHGYWAELGRVHYGCKLLGVRQHMRIITKAQVMLYLLLLSGTLYSSRKVMVHTR